MLPSSLLEFLLPVSLWAGSAYARSAFNIKAHGTGVRYATSGQVSADDIGVSTSDDLSYLVDITLGGQNFTVLLDTGSTDLWVYTKGKDVKFTNTTDLEADIGYGSGGVEGKIQFAEVQIGDFTIQNQAFINATEVVDMQLDDFDGIMGMAFDNADIYNTIRLAWGRDAADALGRAPITALFAQNTSLPNNFDVQLARTSELEDVAEGVFVISDHADGFEGVTEAPQLPRVAADHWSIVMDAMLVDGKSFAFNKSRISGVPSGKIVAALDTGFSFPPLPRAAVDAIYSSIPGAMYDPYGLMWLVPCDASADLSFVFGGQKFPVHPLDLTFPVSFSMSINGTVTNATACINTYQELTLDPSSFTGFDVILGDAFLRNVYASFDYGDYYPANRTNGLPFVQMISTTNTSTMWAEFHEERAATLAELPPTIDPAVIIAAEKEYRESTSSAEDLHSTGLGAAALSDEDDDASSGDSWGQKYGKIVLGLLAANLLVGLVLLAVTVTMCVRGVKGKNVGSRYVPVRFKENTDDFERGAQRYSD